MDKELRQELRRLADILLADRDKMMTTAQAAEYIGCAPRTMRQLADNRDLPYYKDPHGRAIRFRRSDLDAWMEYVRIDSQREVDAAVAHRIIERNPLQI